MLEHASLASMLPLSRGGGRHPHQPHSPQQQQQPQPQRDHRQRQRQQQQQQPSLASSLGGSSSNVFPGSAAAVTSPLNVASGSDFKGDAKHEGSSSAGGGGGSNDAHARGTGSSSPADPTPSSQQQQQHRHQQQQQQQPPRVQHRRPRSIHITLRRTRSGSRPVTAQRNNHHNPVSTSRELAGSAGAASKSTSLLSQSGTVPTPPAAAASSSPSGGAPGTGRHTPPHQRPPQGLPHQRHSSLGSGYGTLGEVLSPVAASPQPGPSPAAAAAAMAGSVSPQLTPCLYDAAGATSTTPNTLTSPIPAGGSGGHAGSAVYRASHYDELTGSGNNNNTNANFNGVSNGSGSPRTVNLPGYTPYVFTHTRGRSGDAAGGLDGAPAGTQVAMGSSSSSMIGGAGGSAGSLGPSPTSIATGPAPYGAGTFNAFVKPNYVHYPSMLKQAALLPPNMRERVLGPDAGAAGPHGGVHHAGDGGGEHGMGRSHRRPLSSGPVPRRTSSLSGSYSRVYAFQPPVISSANPTLSPQPQSCASGGSTGALRSNSMSGYHGVPGLNAYVFPPSDDASLAAAAALAGMQHQTHLMQHPQPQPLGSAWWGHLSNLPTVNLETFSPRMSPRAEMGEGLGANPGAALSMHPQHQQPYPQQQQQGQGQGQAPQRHYRARSYTAGGRLYGNRGVDGQLSLPAATATGTAALFPADTGYHAAGNISGGGGGVSVANSAASRSLDRSASTSSGVPVPPGSAGGASAGASGSTMVQHPHHHHRSGGRRLSSSAVATPVPGATETLPPAPPLTAACTDSAVSTPRPPTAPTTPKTGLTDHNTLAGAGGGSGSGTRYSARVLTASGRAGAAAAAAVAGVSPVVLIQRPSSRAAVSVQSGAFSSTARRSGSSDRVNGLDDSTDSVRCGSLPSASNTFVCLGDAQGRGAAGAGAGGRYGGGTAVFGAAHRYGREHVDETDKAGDEGGSGAGGASDVNPRRLSSGGGGGTGGPAGTSSRYRRYSILTNTTNDDEDDAAAGPPPAAGQLSTLDILRGHQAGANARKDSASGTTRARATRTATTTTTTTATTNINVAAAAAAATPTTAIERWRAQDQQRRREEEEAQRRYAVARQQRLTARQWREAFQRLQENKVRWHMRGYIGRGTSGVVYEGVLEDREHTPVAVKVLEVGVPLPMDLDAGDEEGEEQAGSEAEGHHGRRLTRPAAAASARLAAAPAAVADTPCMSPSQQSALLVLLREVEMMEKLHHENIVTCLRCQVTPVQDRFLELQQQQQHRHDHRRRHGSPSSSGKGGGQRRSAGAEGGDGEGGNNQNTSRHSGASSSRFSGGGNPSPCRSDVALAGPARVPVQVEIVMELCKRGTLASVVRRSPGGQLPVQTARRYLRDVLKGLAYLHRHNFIHRDVKGDNVLISGGDIAKLADFGCSRRIVLTNNVHGGLSGGGGGGGGGGTGSGAGGGGGSSSLITTHTGATDSRMTTVADYQWFDTTGIAQTMVGTPMFMAPEIIQAAGAPPPSAETPTSDSPMSSTEPRLHHGDDGAAAAREGKSGAGADAAAAAASVTGYTASADIWSYGCLVLEVFGRAPWPSAGNNAYHLMKQIEQSVADLPPGVPEDAPADLLHLLRCCFLRDPHRRSSARALLRLPWMTCKDEELEEVPPRRRR